MLRIQYTLPAHLDQWPVDFISWLGSLDHFFGNARERYSTNRYRTFRWHPGKLTMTVTGLEATRMQTFRKITLTARDSGSTLWLRLNAPEGYTILRDTP